jgi:hypothetical protein
MNKDNSTTSCSACGAPWDRRRKTCKQCGGTTKKVFLTLTAECTSKVSGIIDATHEYKQIKPLLNGIVMFLTLGSPLLYFVPHLGIWGVVVGEVLAVICLILGPKALMKVIEKSRSLF